VIFAGLEPSGRSTFVGRAAAIDRHRRRSYADAVSRKPRYTKLVVCLGVVLLLIVFVCLPSPRHVISESGWEIYRFGCMSNIARAINAYAIAHEGRLPAKMSDLFPENLEDPRMLLFRSKDFSPAREVDFHAHPELIDAFCAYAFTRLPDRRVVVFERPGLRKDGRMLYCLMGPDGEAVGDTDCCDVTPEEFVRRLQLAFPDIPGGRDYQRTTSTNIGDFDYGLYYFGKDLHSIHQAYLATGRASITPTEARAKVQAAMDQLDPPGTWQVEEGIQTSDGSTPYYHFVCDLVKDGEKVTSVGALVLFDGTVIAPRKQKLPWK